MTTGLGGKWHHFPQMYWVIISWEWERTVVSRRMSNPTPSSSVILCTTEHKLTVVISLPINDMFSERGKIFWSFNWFSVHAKPEIGGTDISSFLFFGDFFLILFLFFLWTHFELNNHISIHSNFLIICIKSDGYCVFVCTYVMMRHSVYSYVQWLYCHGLEPGIRLIDAESSAAALNLTVW